MYNNIIEVINNVIYEPDQVQGQQSETPLDFLLSHRSDPSLLPLLSLLSEAHGRGLPAGQRSPTSCWRRHRTGTHTPGETRAPLTGTITSFPGSKGILKGLGELIPGAGLSFKPASSISLVLNKEGRWLRGFGQRSWWRLE